MSKIKYFLFLGGIAAFGGQSIRLSTATAGNASVPPQPVGNSFRVEVSFHDWDPNFSGGHPFTALPVGLDFQFQNFGPGNMGLQMYTTSITGGSAYSVCQVALANLPTKFLTVRYQEDAANKIDYCQAWDINGNLVTDSSSPYISQGGVNFAGVSVGSTGQNLSTAYFRIYKTLVSTNARPPVTAAPTTNCLVYWKFDNGNDTGSLNDSCPAGPYNASMSSGSPVYVPTPGQNLVVPVFKTMNAPVWGNTASLRAGFPAQLDGTASYSQVDASGDVSCFWQVLSGPSSPIWDNHGSCAPTVQGLIFGDYTFQLAVRDANGAQVTATLDIGAVATDSNGVVVNADPNIDFLFGPMIAWGKNPWGYQDWWQAHASTLRLADYQSNGWIQGTLNKPQWEYTGQGTASFYFNCVGPAGICNSSLGTTLNGDALATSNTITVTDASKLDLTSLPTHIIFFTGFGPGQSEEVRICSAAGNVLTVCYDGRGQSPQPFASGTPVLQAKVTGNGTKFLTDPTAAVCPVGAPGPPGPSLYSTGTIALAAGSVTVVGAGTTFTDTMVGDYIRVPATHALAPFVFVAQITAFIDSTHLTLARVYPADADAASGLAYNLMLAHRTIVLRAPHATDPSEDGEVMFGTSGGCESETAVYTNPIQAGNTFSIGWDIPALDGTHVIGRPYSITDTSGWVTRFGLFSISFYGESLAHRSMQYRSGLTSAQTAANYIADWWIKSPWGNPDVTPGLPLSTGGEVIGSFASAVLTGRVTWPSLRGYAAAGIRMVNGFASTGCNGFDDTRDSGYAYSWLILAAIYDPDTTSANAPGGIPWRTYWQNQLAQMKANDTRCQSQVPGAAGSFANGFYWNAGLPLLTITNGSAIATGAGLPSGMCNGTATGNAAMTNGSNIVTILTGMIPSGTTDLFLTGTAGGGTKVFVQSIAYTGGVLGASWLGDSGTVTWMSGAIDGYPGDGAPQDMMTIAASNDDLTNLGKNWACVWNNSSSITLNRNWDGPTGSYYAYNGNLAGFGQQPFMLGIKAYGENLLATQTVPALSSYVAPYQTFTENSTNWIWNHGMDHQLFGTSYGRIFQQCEPENTAPVGTNFTFRAPGCTYGNDPTAVYLSREQNSETGAAHAIYYQNNPTLSNRNLGDRFYGALWGFCPWATGGVYCDSNSTAANARGSNLDDLYIHGGKWTGFFAGMGMSHRWPASRLGGVQAPRPRTVLLSLRMADVAGAVSIQVQVTAPSGAQTSVTCSSQPCAVTVDDRQGAHWYQVRYLAAGGAVLSQSQPDLLAAQ
ncbi:MAG TPA: hypothetical protein VGN17_31715 [Bryobacteraceae bacterium]|jgi:hypothetical protein